MLDKSIKETYVRRWKLPVHNTLVESPSPMHELNHSVRYTGKKIKCHES